LAARKAALMRIEVPSDQFFAQGTATIACTSSLAAVLRLI